jgi:hypothetical protein
MTPPDQDQVDPVRLEHAELKALSGLHAAVEDRPEFRLSAEHKSGIAKLRAALTEGDPPPEIPDDYWRRVPCGHPPDPVAMYGDEGRPVCHCGVLLDPAATGDFPVPSEAPGPIVPCQACGCYVAIPPPPTTGDPAGGLAVYSPDHLLARQWRSRAEKAEAEAERLRTVLPGCLGRLGEELYADDVGHLAGPLGQCIADSSGSYALEFCSPADIVDGLTKWLDAHHRKDANDRA